MSVLITGAAGFIGYHVTVALLERGETVVGVDSLNDYYDVELKKARLARLEDLPGFTFVHGDLADAGVPDRILARHGDIDRVVHLAAQPGVRYSLVNPQSYTRNNVDAHVNLLEAVRKQDRMKHFVFASSSSVYGANTKLPYSTDQTTDAPVSLYAATKKSQELISHAFSHLYGLPQTGLRFFTVYGPWGRPDMAYFSFTRKILAGEPIPVFNNGDMRRDFTYIDDIVAGVLGCLDTPPAAGDGVSCRTYNIGNNRAENLMDFIATLEDALGEKAVIDFQPMQPGDVKETFADIAQTTRDFGFVPSTPIDVGVPKFVQWYRGFYG